MSPGPNDTPDKIPIRAHTLKYPVGFTFVWAEVMRLHYWLKYFDGSTMLLLNPIRWTRLFFSPLFRVFLSSRFAVEVCFSNFRPEFFQNWPEFFWKFGHKKGGKGIFRSISELFFCGWGMFLPFWDLSFSKKAEFCQNPEFLLGLSFSQNVEKKSLKICMQMTYFIGLLPAATLSIPYLQIFAPP